MSPALLVTVAIIDEVASVSTIESGSAVTVKVEVFVPFEVNVTSVPLAT